MGVAEEEAEDEMVVEVVQVWLSLRVWHVGCAFAAGRGRVCGCVWCAVAVAASLVFGVLCSALLCVARSSFHLRLRLLCSPLLLSLSEPTPLLLSCSLEPASVRLHNSPSPPLSCALKGWLKAILLSIP